MKKIITAILISCLCLALVSCGSETLKGDTAVFTNQDKSFSIELPAEETKDKDKASWIINEETSGDILDMTDSAETVRVVVQGMSKAKASRIAADFESYKAYVTENTFAELIEGSNMKDATFDVPEFVKNTSASTYSAKKTEGAMVFMETETAYYTYLIVAADGGYKANDKVLKDSILSLKEIPSEDKE